jgi:chromosome segregation ATPase
MYLVIDELRRFDTEGTALEDLVALSSLGRVVQTEFQSLNVEEPEWLNPKLREIRREIQTRQADRIEKLIREKKSRLEALLPAEEKRQALQSEIEKLEKQLAGQ